MRTFGISSAAMVAVALLTCPASAQEAPKGGAAPAGGGAMSAPAGGEGAAGGGTRMLPGEAAPGGAPGKASPGMKPGGAMQAEPGQRQKGENVGEAPAKKPETPNAAAEQRKEPQRQGEPAKAGEEAKPGNKAGTEAQPGKQNAGAAQPGKAARPAPKITNVQETKIQETIRNVNVRPINVNFNIGVGVAVPSTVVLTALPPAIIGIVPEYEGYRFFVVPGQIVIVDPFTLEIVAVLPL